MNQISRRGFINSVAATSVLALLPARLRAEPITAGQAIGAVVGIISAIAGARDQAALRGALKQINAKLDLLVLGQRAILEEIYRLRLFISEALFNQFREGVEYELRALKNRYDFLLAGSYNRRTAGDFGTLANAVQDKTNTLGQYDFGAFVTFLTGVSMALVLRRIMGTAPAQMAALRAGFKQKLDAWLEPGNDRGVVRALELAREETSRAQSDLDRYPRQFEVSHRRDEVRGQRCKFVTILTLSGGTDTPFTGSTREVQTNDCVPIREPDPCKRCLDKEISAFPSLADGTKSLALVEEGPDYSGLPEPLLTDPSPWPQVREANRLRNILIAKQRRERDLTFVRTQIEKAAASLA